MTRTPGPRGPYKLDDGTDPRGVRATILRYLSAGSYLETAASAAGVRREQLWRWLRKAAEQRKRHTRSVYTRFADDVEQAMAKHEGGLVALIVKAGQTQWVAAAWLLERRFPQRYEQHRTTKRLERERLRAERGSTSLPLPQLPPALLDERREVPVDSTPEAEGVPRD